MTGSVEKNHASFLALMSTFTHAELQTLPLWVNSQLDYELWMELQKWAEREERAEEKAMEQAMLRHQQELAWRDMERREASKKPTRGTGFLRQQLRASVQVQQKEFHNERRARGMAIYWKITATCYEKYAERFSGGLTVNRGGRHPMADLMHPRLRLATQGERNVIASYVNRRTGEGTAQGSAMRYFILPGGAQQHQGVPGDQTDPDQDSRSRVFCTVQLPTRSREAHRMADVTLIVVTAFVFPDGRDKDDRRHPSHKARLAAR